MLNLSAGNLTISGVANLGNISNVRISGGGSGYLLQTAGNGTLSWINQADIIAAATVLAVAL